MKKFIIILLGIIVYCSCQDDNKSNRVKPEVSFSDFQDPRDAKTYKCITIGEQTWMAENLKYRSPRGSMDGCYTYGEENMRAQDIVINQEAWADSIQAGITRGEFEGTIGTMKLARRTGLQGSAPSGRRCRCRWLRRSRRRTCRRWR